jgi:Ala-tRNA(Pro) deacylase
MKAAFDSFSHPPSGTIDEWRPHCVENAPGARICKNLFLKDKKKTKILLVTALSETNTDMKVLESLLNLKTLRLTTPDVLMDKLGLKAGAVTPLAAVVDKEKEITFVLDKAMLEAGKTANLLVHPTSGNSYTIALNAETLLKYFANAGIEPIIVDFPPKV